MRFGKRRAAAMISLAAWGMMSAAGSAQAQSTAPGFVYAFGDYDHYDASGGTTDGGGLGLGWRLGRYFGIEAGGQFLSTSGVDSKNGYIQGLFVLPLGSNFALSASLGGAYLDTSTTIGTTSISADGGGYRAGIGMEYWLSPRWALRLGVHRQNAVGVADDYSAGIAYRF